MTESRKLRVFLCHSSQDKPIVRELYQRLLAEGWIDPWLDEEKLLPGQDWDMEIEKAVESADAVIVFLSTNSITKEGYVQKELRFVLDISDEKPDETIFVIPVRLDNCQVPRRLKKWQYVDYFPVDYHKQAYRRLLEALRLRKKNSGIWPEVNIDDSAEMKSNNKVIPLNDFYGKRYLKGLDGVDDLVIEADTNENLSAKQSRVLPNIKLLTVVSGICGGVLGLISFNLPWLVSDVIGEECTGGTLGFAYGYWCNDANSISLLLVPALFLITIGNILFFWWKKRDGLGVRLIDLSALSAAIFSAHLQLIGSRLLPLSSGVLGTSIACFFILFGGFYQYLHDPLLSNGSSKPFWGQRLVVYFIIFAFFSFVLYATGGFK